MNRTSTRREWLGKTLCAAAGALLACTAHTKAADAPDGAAKSSFREIPPWTLYAFDNGLDGPDVSSVESKVALLKKLGYTGMTDQMGRQRLPEVLAALDKQGLEFASYYCTPSVEEPLDPRFADAIALMKGRRARIEIAFASRKFKPSDPAADTLATDMLKRIADLAAESGPLISVYPHKGMWSERVDDGVRLARKVNLKTVGTNLNLVHWKWVPQPRALEEVLLEAVPFLKLVTINGLDKDRIVSLADGDYDVGAFLATVKKAGYTGPIGLQGYSIKGPSETHLKRSMDKWTEIRKALSV